MFDRDIEHPDITSALQCGYPSGAAQENQDTPENRREFAEEFFSDFLAIAQDGDPDILEHFVEHYIWKYREFLN